MAIPNHALILGASGISGWALLNTIRTYPTPTTFARITATTNRPLTLSDAQIPADPRILLVNGIDFTRPAAEVASLLPANIPDINSVTHVFFTAYIARDTFAALKDVNITLLRTAVSVIAGLAPQLQAVILQTGGKAYGVEFTAQLGPLATPLRESLPRVASPNGDNIFYYAQVDILRDLASKSSSNQAWTFTEIRPDVIVGFVPSDNAMDCARGVAFYLTIYKAVHGASAPVPFPGTPRSWTCRHTDTSQDVLAKMEIHCALNQGACGSAEGEAFNIADGCVTTWAAKWPGLCAYFGLEGVGPRGGDDEDKEILRFFEEYRGLWAGIVREHGLKVNAIDNYDADFLFFVMSFFNFDREFDLSKARGVGFTEEVDTIEGYTIAFDRLKVAGIIPA